jgi:hypothetical protein
MLNNSDARSSGECPWAVDLENMAMPSARRRSGITWPEQKYCEYRTKQVILECYDAMAEAMKTGRPFQTILDPPLPSPRRPFTQGVIKNNSLEA